MESSDGPCSPPSSFPGSRRAPRGPVGPRSTDAGSRYARGHRAIIFAVRCATTLASLPLCVLQVYQERRRQEEERERKEQEKRDREEKKRLEREAARAASRTPAHSTPSAASATTPAVPASSPAALAGSMAAGAAPTSATPPAAVCPAERSRDVAMGLHGGVGGRVGCANADSVVVRMIRQTPRKCTCLTTLEQWVGADSHLHTLLPPLPRHCTGRRACRRGRC